MDDRFIKLENFSIEEVLSQVEPYTKEKIRKYFGKYEVKVNSLRLNLFKTKGLACVTCGLIGSYFTLEKTIRDFRPHFNLYGLNEDGEEILMTKDHILPKSLGGKDTLENLQPMCTICNGLKGNNI